MDIRTRLNRLNQEQLKQQSVQEYLQVRKIHQDMYDLMDVTYNKEHAHWFSDIIYLSRYPNMRFNIAQSHDENIYGEVLIYPQHKDIQSKCEYYKENNLLETSEQQDMLEAMLHSIYGMYRIVGRDDLNALTTVENIYTREKITLTDMNLGGLNQSKEVYIYLHIIHYHDIYFQTGLCMFFKISKSTTKWLKQSKNIFMKPYDIDQLLFVEKHYRNRGDGIHEERHVVDEHLGRK
ncbi:MAG: hypothetical protein LUG46_02590 [Erysipelotrichaceae bacterium]|nr:hypothetical protein [Erysipelotrichaceae bacterium]